MAPTEIKMDEGTKDRLIAQAQARQALAEEREEERRNPRPLPPNDGGRVHPPRDPARANAQMIEMPETSTEPTPFNSVKVGHLTVFHSDDGGFFVTSRKKISIIDADGARIDDAQSAIFVLYTELRRLADAARAVKK
jgi:hypothetical protein